MKVKIVCDSSIMYNAEEKVEHDIEITPFIIVIDNESYIDNVDLSPDEFYQKLRENAKVSTSQPNIMATTNLFNEILEDYDHIIYLTLPEKVSGTYNTGVMIANQIDSSRITVIDVYTGCGGVRVLVDNLHEMMRNNASLEEMVAYSKLLSKNSDFWIVPEDLQAVRRSGRMNGMAGAFLDLVKIKVCLTLTDEGGIEKFTLKRTEKKVYQCILDDIVLKGYNKDNSIFYISTGDNVDRANDVKEALVGALGDIEIRMMQVTPAIAIHSGPGSVIIQVVKKKW